MPRENIHCTCLSVILLDSIFVNTNKEYYPQVFLEECKYAVKKKKVMNTIKEELKLDESDDESDKSDESDEQNQDDILRFFFYYYGFNNVCYD